MFKNILNVVLIGSAFSLVACGNKKDSSCGNAEIEMRHRQVERVEKVGAGQFLLRKGNRNISNSDRSYITINNDKFDITSTLRAGYGDGVRDITTLVDFNKNVLENETGAYPFKRDVRLSAEAQRDVYSANVKSLISKSNLDSISGSRHLKVCGLNSAEVRFSVNEKKSRFNGESVAKIRVQITEEYKKSVQHYYRRVY